MTQVKTQMTKDPTIEHTLSKYLRSLNHTFLSSLALSFSYGFQNSGTCIVMGDTIENIDIITVLTTNQILINY